MSDELYLTASERGQISDILKHRANEIAEFSSEYRSKENYWVSVDFALTREIDRLRHLAALVSKPTL